MLCAAGMSPDARVMATPPWKRVAASRVTASPHLGADGTSPALRRRFPSFEDAVRAQPTSASTTALLLLPLRDGISIRRVEPEADLPQIQALFAAGNRGYFESIPEEGYAGGREAMIELWEEEIESAILSDIGPGLGATYLDSPRCGFWCAVDESKDAASSVLGMVGADGHYAGNAERAASVLELRRLSVSSTARGLGLGARLVATVEAHAAAQGFDTVRLGTHPVMAPAVRLYESLGYVRVQDRTEEGGGYNYEKRLGLGASCL
jgi:GNAT superfamily N-acetyltransferase